MKQSLFFLVLCCFFSSFAHAQKFGYVDAEFVLSQMPAYQKAQQEISESATKWESDISDKLTEIQKMKEEFRAEELLLTDDMKQERLEELKKKEKEVTDLQKKIFGVDGLFFNRQQELQKPALEEFYDACSKVARKESLQFIFNNAEGLTVIYAEPRHDYTEEVLEVLGLKKDPDNPEQKN